MCNRRAQVVGWPPVRSCRKNSFLPKKAEAETGMFVKVSMDGAPYLRKIDMKVYKGYSELLNALENMFKLTIGKNLDQWTQTKVHRSDNCVRNSFLFQVLNVESFFVIQVSTQRGKATKDQNMHQLMKTKMVTGC